MWQQCIGNGDTKISNTGPCATNHLIGKANNRNMMG